MTFVDFKLLATVKAEAIREDLASYASAGGFLVF